MGPKQVPSATKNVALEHPHFAEIDLQMMMFLSIAMFECNWDFNNWSIFPKRQDDHIKKDMRHYWDRWGHLCSRRLMAENVIPKVGNSNMWKHRFFIKDILVVLGIHLLLQALNPVR